MKRQDDLDSIENIKKKLVIKIIKGKKYYYIKAQIAVDTNTYKERRNQELYVCPVSTNDEELVEKYYESKQKLIQKVAQHLHELTRKKYKSQFLSKKDLKLLEYLRFGYSVFLNQGAKSDQERYEESFYTKYVYGTTSIEGNTYSLRDTDLTLNEGVTVGGKNKREFYEIENYALLKDFLAKQKNMKLSLKTIKKIHSLILRNIDANIAGSFRKTDVGIRGSEFTPVPGILVEDELNNLITWFETNRKLIHPVEFATIFHQKFEEIHPFDDGNGRVGREILRQMLKKHGYPTIFVDSSNREEYLKCLDKGNKGNNKDLIRFVANNLLKVHNSLIQEARKESKANEQKTVQKI